MEGPCIPQLCQIPWQHAVLRAIQRLVIKLRIYEMETILRETGSRSSSPNGYMRQVIRTTLTMAKLVVATEDALFVYLGPLPAEAETTTQ